MQILTLDTASLGDRSYVLHDGSVAAVIDPQRDIDRVESLLREHGISLVAIFETHIHNDYVSGGMELARRTEARYYLNEAEQVAFAFQPISDADEVQVGTFTLRALHTPGHTPGHLSFIANDGERDIAVFTGGALLYGSVGRTDLIAPDQTEKLTRLQHRSATRIVSTLDDEVEVCPTHGFGSFCSSGEISGSDTSTVGAERRTNQALTTPDEDEFVRTLLARLDAYPAYYAHMAPINRQGPAAVDLSVPTRPDTTDLLRRIGAGEWVVDVRTRTAFARDHLCGTINVELADTASTYVGWLIPWGTPVTLIADGAAEVADVQRQLARIGIDRPAGQRPDGLAGIDGSAPRGRFEITDFGGLRHALDEGMELVVLDTRRNLEWTDGHLPMAVHIPLHELPGRLEELGEREVWVHCATGYRASIAASLIAQSGRIPVLINDDFDSSAPRHFTITRADAGPSPSSGHRVA